MFKKVSAIPFEYLMPASNFYLNFKVKLGPFYDVFLWMLFNFRWNIAPSHIVLKTDNLFPFQCLKNGYHVYVLKLKDLGSQEEYFI